MYFNLWDSSKILYVIGLLFTLFLIIYIVIYFFIKGFKAYKKYSEQKSLKQELLENILKSDDVDKINLMLKHINISSTYEISNKLNLDNKDVEYMLKSGNISLLSNLLSKKIKGN